MIPSLPRRALAGAFALAALTAPAAASAQINVEALRTDIGSRDFFIAGQVSYAGHAGNVNGSVASAAGFAGVNVGRHLAFLKAQGDYAQFSGEATISKAFVHARYNFRILRWLFGEAFVQVEMNKFQRLALRQLDGLGLRFAAVQNDTVQLYYGTAWMLDYEQLSQSDGLIKPFAGAAWVAQRWSNYAALGLRLGTRVRFADAFYVQPRVNGFYDVRLLNEASFSVDIDKRFSGKIMCQVHYNSTPPSRVGPTDVDTLTSLVVTF